MARLRDHIVICNWSDRAADLIRAIHADLFIQHRNQLDWRPVVVVAENVTGFPDEDAFRGTVLLPGSPLSTSMLERANIQEAHAVVIMADPDSQDADDRSIMIAINASSVLKEDVDSDGTGDLEPTRIVVEMVHPDRARMLCGQKLSLVDEVVCQADLNIRVVAQSNISRGLTVVLRELLEFSEDNDECYLIKVPVGWAGLAIGKDRFFDLVRWVGEQSRIGKDPATTPVTLLVGFVRERKGMRQMIVNPKPAEYRTLKSVQAGDSLILIARDRDVAKEVRSYPVVKEAVVEEKDELKSAEAEG